MQFVHIFLTFLFITAGRRSDNNSAQDIHDYKTKLFQQARLKRSDEVHVLIDL